jgi:hypothetical protein
LALFGAVIEEIRFARDSPLEETGFELPVPLSRNGLGGAAGGNAGTISLAA